jgi:hypothetical protein
MAWEHKPNFGSAFMNKEKTEDWHAEFRGDIMLPDGTLHYLDVSPAKTKAGDPYYKVKIGKVKMSAGHSGPDISQHNQAKANAYQPQGGNDDIPF